MSGRRAKGLDASSPQRGPKEYKNNQSANTSAVKQSNRFGGALGFAIRAHAGRTSGVKALHRNRAGTGADWLYENSQK
jgi:hypothetical protein